MGTQDNAAGDARLVLREFPDYHYTQCYCEENVYMLCKSLHDRGLASSDYSDLFVVFISNARQQVPIWRQRNGRESEGYCVWDYHVICIQKCQRADVAVVWDLDTTLPLPTPLDQYILEAFRPQVRLLPQLHRFFRVIGASRFLRHFASDRRHMLDPESNLWISNPPCYNCIVAEDGALHNLDQYYTINEEQDLQHLDIAIRRIAEERLGVVVSQADLLRVFSCLTAQAGSG